MKYYVKDCNVEFYKTVWMEKKKKNQYIFAESHLNYYEVFKQIILSNCLSLAYF